MSCAKDGAVSEFPFDSGDLFDITNNRGETVLHVAAVAIPAPASDGDGDKNDDFAFGTDALALEACLETALYEMGNNKKPSAG